MIKNNHQSILCWYAEVAKLGRWYANYFGKVDVRNLDVFLEKIYSKMIVSLHTLVQCKLPPKESMP